MKIIASVKEDYNTEKRISITPETTKKLINLNFSVFLEKTYGLHLGITDEEYKDSGAILQNSAKEVLEKSDIILRVSCPSGEDIRGWLQIIRGMEQPPQEMTWQEYAFHRSTDANPFPAMMGRVCPAPCEDGCSRNLVEEFVGINAAEQFIGDTAFREGYRFAEVPVLSGKQVAIVGGGPAGLSAAYQLRKKGHASAVFEMQAQLGGMFRYGIPGYRTPRDILDREIERIIELGDIEVQTGVRVGEDITIGQLEKDFDAILWTIGCQTGRDLPVAGWNDTPNCVSGVKFLEAFNKGTLQVSAERVICIGGGGLIGGVASWIKNCSPKTKIVGCLPENAPEMYLSVKAGKVIGLNEPVETLSDGSAGGLEEASITFPICQKLVDDFILVSEEEIASAIKLIHEKHNKIIGNLMIQ